MSTTRLMCHRIQAMELHCSAGIRFMVSWSRPSMAESTMAQFRCRVLTTDSVGDTSLYLPFI